MCIHSTEFNTEDSRSVEIWRDLPERRGRYQVSSWGRVRSLNMVIRYKYNRIYFKKGRILKDWSIPTGYVYVNVGTRNGAIQRLVLQTFVGPCPEGMEACHNDGNPGNNKVWNLRWDSKKNNEADKLLHGTGDRSKNGLKGEKNHKAKLNPEKVREIRSLYASGKYLQVEIALMYGVGQDQISSIVLRKSWAHVD
mgnify:FL=1